MFRNLPSAAEYATAGVKSNQGRPVAFSDVQLLHSRELLCHPSFPVTHVISFGELIADLDHSSRSFLKTDQGEKNVSK